MTGNVIYLLKENSGYNQTLTVCMDGNFGLAQKMNSGRDICTDNTEDKGFFLSIQLFMWT